MKSSYAEIFKHFGITNLEIEILEILAECRRELTIKDISSKLACRGENLYRPLKKLLEKGFIIHIDTYPDRYKFKNWDRILRKKITEEKIQLQDFQEVLGTSKKIDASLSVFEVIQSREEYKRRGDSLMLQVEDVLRIIASGSEQSREFWKKHFDVIKRGASIRFLINNLNNENLDMYKNWERTGIILRRMPLGGLNLILYDNDAVQMGFRPEKSSRDKIGIITKDENIVLFFSKYFDILWKNSERVRFQDL
ncbi:MAG: helix-turn-helix domain-containing protein [Candidatus Dojkabacteria bacterium]|nr:helix-turn-helix domain-containing protein [Candidatus Dojkabacteria bacterium]